MNIKNNKILKSNVEFHKKKKKKKKKKKTKKIKNLKKNFKKI